MAQDVDLRKILAKNIKKQRDIMGISQDKLAEKAEISAQMLRDIEGCRTWVSDKTLVKLANALNTDSYRFLMSSIDHDEEVNQAFLLDLLKILQKLRKNMEFDIDKAVNLLVLKKKTDSKAP